LQNWKQLQESVGCVKLTIDGNMLTLKEEASIEEFYLIWAYSGGITSVADPDHFDADPDLDPTSEKKPDPDPDPDPTDKS
jgi:hypothetical protein